MSIAGRLPFLAKKYRQLPSVEDADDCEDQDISRREPCNFHISPDSPRWTLLGIFLCTATVAGLYIGTWLGRRSAMRDLDNLCIRHISRGSPFIEDIGIKWSTREIDGRVFHSNEYKHDPDEQVDKLWDGLGGTLQEIVIPEAVAESAGMTDEKGFVRVRPEYGGGFLGEVDGLHHMHCLNSLRMTLHWNFAHYKKLGKPLFKTRLGEYDDLVAKYHVYHCLDILRQELMCNVDVGIAPFVWSNYSIWNDTTGWGRPEPAPTSYFSNPKPCRNFWDVVEYTRQRQWMPNMSFQEHRKMLVLPGEGTRIYGLP